MRRTRGTLLAASLIDGAMRVLWILVAIIAIQRESAPAWAWVLFVAFGVLCFSIFPDKRRRR